MSRFGDASHVRISNMRFLANAYDHLSRGCPRWNHGCSWRAAFIVHNQPPQPNDRPGFILNSLSLHRPWARRKAKTLTLTTFLVQNQKTTPPQRRCVSRHLTWLAVLHVVRQRHRPKWRLPRSPQNQLRNRRPLLQKRRQRLSQPRRRKFSLIMMRTERIVLLK